MFDGANIGPQRLLLVWADEALSMNLIYLSGSIAILALSALTGGLLLGLLSLDTFEVEVLVRSGTDKEKRDAAAIMPFIKRPHLLLVSLLLTNTACMEILPILLHSLVEPAYAIIISICGVLIVGEIIPQAICTRHGLSVSAKLHWIVRIIMVLTFPIAWPIAKLLDHCIGVDHNILFRRRQLKAIVDLHGAEEGLGGNLTTHEVNVITGALDMTHKIAMEAMTPLHHTFMLSMQDVLDDPTIQCILRSGHSRIPVHSGDNRHAVVGLLMVKELLQAVMGHPTEPGGRALPVKKLQLRTLPRLSATTPMFEVLTLFQGGRSHMAVLTQPQPQELEDLAKAVAEMDPSEQGALSELVDPLIKPGEPVGIITIEDVLETLLQTDIVDETDEYVDRRTFNRVTSRGPVHGLFVHPAPSTTHTVTHTPNRSRRTSCLHVVHLGVGQHALAVARAPPTPQTRRDSLDAGHVHGHLSLLLSSQHHSSLSLSSGLQSFYPGSGNFGGAHDVTRRSSILSGYGSGLTRLEQQLLMHLVPGSPTASAINTTGFAADEDPGASQCAQLAPDCGIPLVRDLSVAASASAGEGGGGIPAAGCVSPRAQSCRLALRFALGRMVPQIQQMRPPLPSVEVDAAQQASVASPEPQLLLPPMSTAAASIPLRACPPLVTAGVGTPASLSTSNPAFVVDPTDQRGAPAPAKATASAFAAVAGQAKNSPGLFHKPGMPNAAAMLRARLLQARASAGSSPCTSICAGTQSHNHDLQQPSPPVLHKCNAFGHLDPPAAAPTESATEVVSGGRLDRVSSAGRTSDASSTERMSATSARPSRASLDNGMRRALRLQMAALGCSAPHCSGASDAGKHTALHNGSIVSTAPGHFSRPRSLRTSPHQSQGQLLLLAAGATDHISCSMAGTAQLALQGAAPQQQSHSYHGRSSSNPGDDFLGPALPPFPLQSLSAQSPRKWKPSERAPQHHYNSFYVVPHIGSSCGLDMLGCSGTLEELTGESGSSEGLVQCRAQMQQHLPASLACTGGCAANINDHADPFTARSPSLMSTAITYASLGGGRRCCLLESKPSSPLSAGVLLGKVIEQGSDSESGPSSLLMTLLETNSPTGAQHMQSVVQVQQALPEPLQEPRGFRAAGDVFSKAPAPALPTINLTTAPLKPPTRGAAKIAVAESLGPHSHAAVKTVAFSSVVMAASGVSTAAAMAQASTSRAGSAIKGLSKVTK